MPTTRRYRRRATKGITPRIIETYRRLEELKAMNLPADDPRCLAHGEMAMLDYEIHKALDIKPWDCDIGGKLEALKQAAEASL